MRFKNLFIVCFVLFAQNIYAQTISQSFELRYFTNDEKANGETDFKGETEYFNTEQRVEYLSKYAEVAREFFNDPNLDTKVVSESQIKQAVQKLKPQPLPEVRRRILLDQWKWVGYKPGQIETEKEKLQLWTSHQDVVADAGELKFQSKTKIAIPIEKQSWRFFLEWQVKGKSKASFKLAGENKDLLKVGLNNGQLSIHSGENVISHELENSNESYLIKVEPDLENDRFNTYVNDVLVADFVPVLNHITIDRFIIEGSKGLQLDNVYGVGYQKSEFTEDIHTRDIPYSIHTFLDEDFELKPVMEGWQNLDYDDSQWKTASLPHPHGGERYAGENLYMRTIIAPEDFERANLVFETLDPGGEIWINGEIVFLTHERHPGEIDISGYLIPDQKNIIALKIYPNNVEHTNRHTVADFHTGWFAGRMHIDFTGKRIITDVFTFTKSLSEGAVQEVRLKLMNLDWEEDENEMKKTREFNGSLRLELFPWYPDEGKKAVATKEIPVNLRLLKDEEFVTDMVIPAPELWTPEHPRLYKLKVTLLNENGNPVDDFVVTTGIRTISQERGTFRLNGKPAMMNGALLFGYKSPLDKIAQWLRAGPQDWLVREILMIKNMNANTIRMSIHHGMKGGVNDPRLAEIGDQLGVMFQWMTGTWVRTASPWILDFEGLPKYVKQVRNHPSIVMWQPANHPKFVDFEKETIPWYEKVYDNIYQNDPSRLINPAANITRSLGSNDDGTLDSKGRPTDPFSVWTAPMITRGDMDHATGYGTEWSTLRLYPDPPDWDGEQGWRREGHRRDYLNSKERAYFDFENEESIGQPNWKLRKGKPSYQIKSYELKYDVGSIGRELSVDEWQESQAWQAFSAFEAYKKKRWLDYDGLAWCTLHGGGNTATYQKPLIDFYGHAKLAYYAVKMALQNTLAGTHNVDMVYGPEDKVKPVIMHLGNEMVVDLVVNIQDLNGNVVASEKYVNVALESGRTVKTLAEFKPNVEDGYYILIYKIVN